ncbi:MAG TPA: ABC transporter ATP-binding protein [Mycobacteriales bacterium]|nr:ABC transporter ATP-binding protein [Mycobacteriales bacterium]
MAAVEVSNLAKRYGTTVAVTDVSFRAEAGAVTAVLGPNGAGKTTSIDCCCGLRRPDAGRLRVLGLDPARDAEALRERVGVMPQAGGSSASGVYPAVRTAEALALFAAQYAEPLPAAALLDRLDLARVANRPWRRLSGGEQQRLSLALAVIGRPQVVFLDEPTAGLDVAARHVTWQLIADLRAAGVAVVLTTHAMDEAEQLADQVVILDAGRIVAAGSPTELSGATAGAVLRFDSAPGLPLADLLGTLPPGTTATEPSPGRYQIVGRIDPHLVAAVTAWCAARGAMLARLQTGARSLEEVYLDLTGKGGSG